ncbi:hypothetical protein N7463_009498 [Penicillium fimorum]|uniref:Uncharacterized protein n=1 Tax=Penicillium fimorum TaxID=1882269 RepID=A0A9W9XQU3_9EURO|nr:hypothetical protein N7463_009498 [Penicillium fimorum]
MLADALQSLHLRALKQLCENRLIDQFLSVYFISDQDAMILDGLVCLEDTGTEATEADDWEEYVHGRGRSMRHVEESQAPFSHAANGGSATSEWPLNGSIRSWRSWYMRSL